MILASPSPVLGRHLCSCSNLIMSCMEQEKKLPYMASSSAPGGSWPIRHMAFWSITVDCCRRTAPRHGRGGHPLHLLLLQRPEANSALQCHNAKNDTELSQEYPAKSSHIQVGAASLDFILEKECVMEEATVVYLVQCLQ